MTDVYSMLLIASGVFGGIIIGAVPGLTATMAVALLVPVTYGMPMMPAIALLLGVYVGSISGGFVSAILLNIPGTPSSVATTFDGYPMVQKGEHEKALGLALIASFIGGTFSGFVLMFIAPRLAQYALKFGPFEYFALVVFTFSCVSTFSKSILKSFFAAFLGMSISMIGVGPIMSVERLNFGQVQLAAGFSLMPALIGLFALPQIIKDIRTLTKKHDHIAYKIHPLNLIRCIFLFKDSVKNMVRTAVIGTGIGILPGVGPGLSNIVSYSQAKSGSKNPDEFGKGAPDGVIAAEGANNASMGGALVPMLTLGIPGDAVTLMMMGAFMLHDIQPGPLMFKTNSDIVYTIFVAFLIACMFVLFFQTFFMGLYVKVLNVPKEYLGSVLLAMCVVGSFALNNRMFDVYCFMGFGILGYFLELVKIPNLPVILGLILGPMAENHLRSGLDISDGSLLPLVTRPIPLIFLAMGLLPFFLPLVKSKMAKNKMNKKERQI